MGNWDMQRWEVQGRAAAHQSMAGERRGAQQIDGQVKARAAAYRRMAQDARLEAGLDASRPSFRIPRESFPLLIGLAGVLLWLVAR